MKKHLKEIEVSYLIYTDILKLLKQKYSNLEFLEDGKVIIIYRLKRMCQNPKNQEILNRARSGEIILGLYTSDEASREFVDNIYRDLVIDQDIPESQIMMIGSCISYKDYIFSVAEKLNRKPIRLEFYDIFEPMTKKLWLQHITGLEPEKIKDDLYYSFKSGLNKEKTNKKFIFQNSRWRKHRVSILCMLHAMGLTEHGYISFAEAPKKAIEKYYNQENPWENTFKDVCDFFQNEELQKILQSGFDVKKELPLILDTTKFRENLTFHSSYRAQLYYFTNSYFSIVTETHYDTGKMNFLTEKTFKSILFKSPFLLVTTPGSLETLKQLGYKTFDGIIDESYDKELDNSKRMLLLGKEIERLCNLNDGELQEFKNKCLPIVDYNYDLLMNKHSYNFTLI
jgi:hypothetical protein